jgi:hypothetical protein
MIYLPEPKMEEFLRLGNKRFVLQAVCLLAKRQRDDSVNLLQPPHSRSQILQIRW